MFYSSMSVTKKKKKKIPSLKLRHPENKPKKKSCSHVKTWFLCSMAIKKKLSPQTPCFCNNSRYSYYVNPAANVMQFNKHIFFVVYKNIQPLKSCSGPAHAVKLCHQASGPKEKKKVKKLRYTVHVYLNWKCRTVKVPYKVLWFFFLSKYVHQKSPFNHSFKHARTPEKKKSVLF